MTARYSGFVRALRDRVLTSAGVIDASLRQAIEANSAAAGGRVDAVTSIVPAALQTYVDKVARRAYEVRDEDIAALRAAGYSEDAIFEITVSAALGAGLGRLERGTAALEGRV